MYEHPDPLVNEALAEALADPYRVIRDKIVFDFNNDGLFDHEYSDLSEVLIDADLERSTLKTDMPDAINTIQGFSSAELNITLQGARNSDEQSIARVLSPYEIGLPFFNTKLNGVDVRYSQIVETRLGEVEIRRFTGVIRDIQFNRKAETVTMICSDALKWINAAATLQHWAVDNWQVDDWQLGNRRPINSAWVVGDLLRQAGTPIGPLERQDAIASVSGMGSLLYSVGRRRWHDALEPERHLLPTDNMILWETGLYGPNLKAVTGTGQARLKANNQFFTTKALYVPQNGSADGPINIGFNVWSKSAGAPAARPHPNGVPGTGNVYYLDGTAMWLGLTDDPAIQNIYINVAVNGQVYVTLYENFGVGTTWFWTFPPQPAGWHYYDVLFKFRNNNMTVELLVDGVTVTATSAANPGRGWNWTGNTDHIPSAGEYAPVTILAFDPSQHWQIYYGNANAAYAPVFIPGQQHPPTTKDGLPWIVFGGCLAELSFLEEVWNESVWEVLQKVAAAEFAGLYTNEWGQLVWAPHAKLRQNAQTIQPIEYTVEDILDQIMNPSLDQYKNEIVIAYTDRNQVSEDVWSPDGWKEFLVPDDGVVRVFGPYLLDDIVQLANQPALMPGWKNMTVRDIPYWKEYASRLSYIYANNLTIDGSDPNHDGATGDWVPVSTSLFLSQDQRSFTIQFYVPPDARVTGIYFGALPVEDAGVNGQPPIPEIFFNVRAKKLGEKRVGYYTLRDEAEITAEGRYSLMLEEAPWRQTFATAAAIAPELMADTKEPTPIIRDLKIPRDPRLQITDTVTLVPGNGVSGDVIAQIVGLRDSARQAQTSIDVRIVRSVSSWILGSSQLGINTVLGD